MAVESTIWVKAAILHLGKTLLQGIKQQLAICLGNAVKLPWEWQL
jgi:hypothetical protein